MIYYLPEGGLGNRIITIFNAQAIFEEKGIKGVVCWTPSRGCFCKWSDLFCRYDGDGIKIRTIRPTDYLFHRLGIGRKSINSIYEAEDWYKTDFDKNKTYSIKMFCGFMIPQKTDGIKLLPELQKEVDTVLDKDNCSKRLVGIQIRRTDHTLSIEQSPIELFEDYMDKEMSLDENVRFYVATDDSTVLERLKNRYGTRILHYSQRPVSRKSVRGMKDAAIDMFALSECDVIYGSYGSTFSVAASYIGKKELISVCSEK